MGFTEGGEKPKPTLLYCMKYETSGFGVDTFWGFEIKEDEEGSFDTFEEAKDSILSYYEEMMQEYQKEYNHLNDCQSFEEYDE